MKILLIAMLLLFVPYSIGRTGCYHQNSILLESDSTRILKKEGKYGVLNTDGDTRVPFIYTELYFVTRGSESIFWPQNGYMGRVGDTWSYIGVTGKVERKGIEFDEWLGNGRYDFPFVRIGDKVNMFDTEALELITLEAYDTSKNAEDPFSMEHHTSIAHTVILQNEGTGLHGIFDNLGNIQLPFDYPEVYPVKRKFQQVGYMVNDGDTWSYLDRFLEVKKSGVEFDQWIGNSKHTHSFVLKNEKVQLFDIDAMEVRALQSEPKYYGKLDPDSWKNLNLIIVKHDRIKKYGAFDREGNIVIPFNYQAIFGEFSEPGAPYLAKYGNSSGDFYSSDGEFIVHTENDAYFLGGDGEYIQLKSGSDRYAYAALAKLNFKKKSLEMVTEFDFWYMNSISRDETSLRVAKASYHDKREVYIYADGRVEPITP